MVPISYPNFPKGFVEKMFHAITASEIRAPTTRDIRKGAFDLYSFTGELNHRLLNAGECQMMSIEEFISTSDLTQDQLYDKHN